MYDIMQKSKAGDTFFDQMGGKHELEVTCFKGFTPYFKQPKHGMLNQGSSALRWAEQLLKGICNDDVEMCMVAMEHDRSNFDVKVDKTDEGAPYRFGSAGFFTKDQMTENTEILKTLIKDRIDKSQIFVTNNEWEQIREYIENTGRYSDPRFEKAVKGDSALMIAVRLRSFKAAKYLLRSGVDAAVTNVDGETIAGVIKTKQEEIMEERNHIRFLRVQAKSVRQMALSHEDQLALLSEPQVYHQLEQNYELCKDISKVMEVRITNINLLKMKKKLLGVEGKELSREEVAEIALEGNIVESKVIVDKLVIEVEDVVAEWGGSRVAKERLRKREQKEEADKHEQKLQYWKKSLFNSCVKIQAAWRGAMTRELLQILALHRACVFVQSRTRGFLTRGSFKRGIITRCVHYFVYIGALIHLLPACSQKKLFFYLRSLVTCIQKVGRGYIGRKKFARLCGRVYPSTASIRAVREASIRSGVAGEEEHVKMAWEYVKDIFDDLDDPPPANIAPQPKGQWAILRYSGQKRALEDLKSQCLEDRKSGLKLGRLAVLCSEHGFGDSQFTRADQRNEFVHCALALFERTLQLCPEANDLVHQFERKRGETMLGAFVRFGVAGDLEYLARAKDAFTAALTSIECTFLPEVWMGKAVAQEYSGEYEAAAKTVAAVVRKFPKYDKMEEVSVRAASLHMALEDYGVASSYIRHASKKGRGAIFLSHMDLALVSGRFNEMWSQKISMELENSEDCNSGSDDDEEEEEQEEDGGDDEDEDKDEEEEEEQRAAKAAAKRMEKEKERDEKLEASQKAYKLVYRHYVEHRNVFGKRGFESWVHHPGTWLRVAARASKSGLYLLADDLYNQALERCGWWHEFRTKGELIDLEEEEEQEAQEEEGVAKDNDNNNNASPMERGKQLRHEEEDEVSIGQHSLGNEKKHYQDLKETSVRILFELAKCKWYQSELESALEYLEIAKEAELHTDSKGKLEVLALASNSWKPANRKKLEKNVKQPFPNLVRKIPAL